MPQDEETGMPRAWERVPGEGPGVKKFAVSPRYQPERTGAEEQAGQGGRGQVTPAGIGVGAWRQREPLTAFQAGRVTLPALCT